MLTSDKRQAGCQRLRMFGEKLLEVRLNAVLLEPRVDAELMGGVVEDLRQPDLKRVAVPASYFPTGRQRLAAQR